MKSADIPTGMGEQVAISVNDGTSSPLPQPQPQPQPYATPIVMLRVAGYMLLLVRILVICLLVGMRIRAFGSNGVFKIVCIVALSAIAVVQVLLGWPTLCLQLYMMDIYYRIVTFIGSLSMFVAPFSLMMVLVLNPKLNWIAYLVVCVMFGILATRFYLEEYEPGKRISSTFNYLVIFLIPSLITLAYFLPESLNRIVYPVIYISLGMENTYHVFANLMLVYKITRKARNMVAN